MRDNTFRVFEDGDDVDFDTDADADADDATACDVTAFGDEVCCFFVWGSAGPVHAGQTYASV